MAKAQSVAEIREHFAEQVVEKLTQTGTAIYEAAHREDAAKRRPWHQLTRGFDGEDGPWSGKLFALEGLRSAFDRSELTEDMLAAIRDASQPGTIGDLVAITLQSDWLAAMERSFRSRHGTYVRAIMHAAGRRRGHGHPGGVVRRGILGQLENILRMSKSEAPDS